MKIRVFNRLVNGVCIASINTEDWSNDDVSRMERLGEPEISLGGTFVLGSDSSGSGSSAGSFTLGSAYARIKTGAPFTQSFDSRDLNGLENAVSASAVWKDAIIARITFAVETLRKTDAIFNEEEVHEI